MVRVKEVKRYIVDIVVNLEAREFIFEKIDGYSVLSTLLVYWYGWLRLFR